MLFVSPALNCFFQLSAVLQNIIGSDWLCHRYPHLTHHCEIAWHLFSGLLSELTYSTGPCVLMSSHSSHQSILPYGISGHVSEGCCNISSDNWCLFITNIQWTNAFILCLCVRVHTCVYTPTCGGQSSMLSVFFSSLHLIFWESFSNWIWSSLIG